MLDWSHSLLPSFDQKVFRRLAAFPAGFSLEAAVAVAGGDEAERWEVVDALGRLIDQSLLTLEQREPARYRLLETLRLYATTKLRQAGETDAIAELHARHFIEVFDEAERCWEETPDPDWIARYQPELDNLRAALDWALAAPDRRQIATALAASGFVLLRWLWLIAEGRTYLDRLIRLLDAETPATLAARLLNHAANFCLLPADPKGLALAERAAALCRECDERPGAATALVTIAQYEIAQGRYAEAKGQLLEARHLLAGRSLKKSQLRLSAMFGLVSSCLNEVADARRYYLEALESARALRSRVEAAILTNLGYLEQVSGNIDRAIELMRAALDRSNSQLGYGDRGVAFANLGEYLIAKGRLAEARSQLEDALSILIDSGTYSSLICLQPWAGLAGLEGRLPEAAQLVGFIDAERARRGQLLYPGEHALYDRLMGILQAGLPSVELEASKSKGARWSEAEAIQFVVERLLHGPISEDLSAGS
jgi:tetratricopeptide (TPR) repeat protein